MGGPRVLLECSALSVLQSCVVYVCVKLFHLIDTKKQDKAQVSLFFHFSLFTLERDMERDYSNNDKQTRKWRQESMLV